MKTVRLLFLLVIIFLLFSCRKDDSPIPPNPGADIIQFDGKFEQNSGNLVSLNDLTILSVTGETDGYEISDDGNFEIESIQNIKYQFFFVNSKVSGEVIYYGISDPGTKKIIINDSTTALGLLMINPYLIGTEQEQRKQFLDQVCTEDEFPKLLEAISRARIDDPHNPLNMDKNPGIFQLTNELMMSAFEKLGAKGGHKGIADDGHNERPIAAIDGPGNEVIFKNYSFIYYGADISYPIDNKKNKEILLFRKVKLLEWKWWPLSDFGPHFLKPEETSCNIDDGVFDMNFYGFNLGDLSTKWNVRDRATVYNLCYGIWYIMDIILGSKDYINNKDSDYKSLGMMIGNSNELINISAALREGNADELINSIIQLIECDIGAQIINNIFKTEIKPEFSDAALKKLRKATLILDLLGYCNEHLPFFKDLVFAPSQIESTYTSTNGVLTFGSSNKPPEATIKVSPSIGYKETQVTFSCEYSDDYTPKTKALYSWKWVEENSPDDDVWSVPSSNPDTSLTLSEPGTMWLKVDDRLGGEDITAKKLPFYESVTKSRVIIAGECYFKDLLNDLGYHDNDDSPLKLIFSELVYVDEMVMQIPNPSLLDTLTDLLIINTDDETMGTEQWYIDNKLEIIKFVKDGGNLLFIQKGWYVGLIKEDVYYLRKKHGRTPTKICKGPYSNRNFLPGYDVNITYSNAVFKEIPTDPEPTIHLVDNYGEPMLIERKKGKGVIMNSTIPDLAWGTNTDSIQINILNYMVGAIFK